VSIRASDRHSPSLKRSFGAGTQGSRSVSKKSVAQRSRLTRAGRPKASGLPRSPESTVDRMDAIERQIERFAPASYLRAAPEEVTRCNRSDDRSALTDWIDNLVQVLDLQPVIQGVAKPMAPVKKRQGASQEENQARSRMVQ
jgi:hypothetical protein